MTVEFKTMSNFFSQTPEPPSFEEFIKHKQSMKQTDELGFFISYYTTSTKKPYVWTKLDYGGFTSPEFFGSTFEMVKKGSLDYKQKQDTWTGLKIVGFTVDPLNPTKVQVLSHYCYEEFSPKKKTYINGPKAEKTFLAQKGKHFTTKASV